MILSFVSARRGNRGKQKCKKQKMPTCITRNGIIRLDFRRVIDTVGATVGAVDAGDADADGACYICAHSFCEEDDCCRSMTHLACCTQTICCGCLLKSCYRCVCREDCEAVVSFCPFCRSNRPVEALDMFLGGTRPCSACSKVENESTSAESGRPAVGDS